MARPPGRPVRVYSLASHLAACHPGGVLSQAEIDSFAADGFVAEQVQRQQPALTRVRPGSHRDAARVLAPAGDEGMPFPQAAQLAAQASAARPTALAVGRAGDVFLCHPFLVHAASWPHTGRHPRIMAQPGVALHDAFPLVPPLSPVELAMAAGG